MSIPGVSSSIANFQNTIPTLFQQLRKDFIDLEQTLNSGDLSGAQKAYAAVQQDMQNLGHQPEGSGQLSTDLTALGNAFQSGDLSGARKAYATLKQDMQKAPTAVGTPHRHHQNTGSAQNATETLGDDLTALGNALPSGDRSGAQKAYGAVMQDIRSKPYGISTSGTGNSANPVFIGPNIDVTI